MSLGETIYRLRTEKSLSQGDLAEMLDVSRQSISKWENNSAVPDLDKLIKLGEIFGVSLDELVKGEPHVKKSSPVEEKKREEGGFPPRKIAGTILLCMGFLVVLFFFVMGAALGGLIFASPFLVCGIICFAFKKNVGLWCAWAVFFLVDIYMIFATGIHRSSVLYTFQWEPHMNYMRLAFAWVSLIALIILIGVTVVRFRIRKYQAEKRAIRNLIVSWGVLVGLQVIALVWPRTKIFNYLLAHILSMSTIYTLVNICLEWARIVALTVALVNTVRFLRRRKAIN
ncbi:MAG: helix-turn-helix domain-containing protein [Lachnospiraceae bacterium]|nr:helix-turn-helix domain-containing protein [Lachnospiraceae bacterium]